MLKALRDYYYTIEKLTSDPCLDEIPVLGIVELNHDGTPAGLVLTHQDDEVYSTRVPNQVKRASGVISNYLVDKSSYIFGRDPKNIKTKKEKEFRDFRKTNLEALDGIDCESAVIFKKFLNLPIDYPDFEIFSEEIMKNDLKDPKVQWISFRIRDSQQFIHEDPEILKSIQDSNKKRQSSVGFSLLSGKNESIIRLHPSIKGLMGSPGPGASLISFNEDSISHNNTKLKQGMLSPIGYEDAQAISKALNYLVKNNNQRIDYLNILCFSNASKDCERIVRECFQWDEEDENEDEELKTIIYQITKGRMPRLFVKDSQQLSPKEQIKRENYCLEKPFYILALQANAGRISPLFFYQDTFGKLIENFISFYNAVAIETSGGVAHLNINRIIKSHKSNIKKKESRIRKTETALVECIVFGRKIPKAYYLEILQQLNKRKFLKKVPDRIKDQELEMDQMSLVKAYLIRNTNQFKKEELRMGLNIESRNTAYLLGRIFAICDQAEGRNDQSAMRYKLQSKASKNPASVYPLILEKTNIRLRKDPGKAIYFGRLVGEVMDLLEVDEYPVVLTQEEQGSWWIGYYQQRQELFKKKEVEKQTEQQETEKN